MEEKKVKDKSGLIRFIITVSIVTALVIYAKFFW